MTHGLLLDTTEADVNSWEKSTTNGLRITEIHSTKKATFITFVNSMWLKGSCLALKKGRPGDSKIVCARAHTNMSFVVSAKAWPSHSKLSINETAVEKTSQACERIR